MRGYALFFLPLLVLFQAAAQEVWPPASDGGNEWMDRDTGHRVVRLSRREGANEVFYFHQNPFPASGNQMLFIGHAPEGRCAFSVDLNTYEVRQITTANVNFEVVAPKSGRLFYASGDTVYATQVDTLDTKSIATVPHCYTWGRGLSVNSDETLLAGCYCLGEEKYYQSGLPRNEWIRALWKAKLPNALFTIDIATGNIAEILKENDWYGHVQFSPADPGQIEFCHEGPGHDLDRMWLVRADGTGLRKLYTKKNANELQTHEFWSPDGKAVWCDFQTPRTLASIFPVMEAFSYPRYYVAATGIAAGDTTRYRIPMYCASRHFNISPDQTMLCGDGEGGELRLCPSGKWIYLFRFKEGKLCPEKLCGMATHSWGPYPEPNTHFTPDGKWVVFQSDASGTTQVYAVEVEAQK